MTPARNKSGIFQFHTTQCCVTCRTSHFVSHFCAIAFHVILGAATSNTAGTRHACHNWREHVSYWRCERAIVWVPLPHSRTKPVYPPLRWHCARSLSHSLARAVDVYRSVGLCMVCISLTFCLASHPHVKRKECLVCILPSGHPVVLIFTQNLSFSYPKRNCAGVS